MEGFKKFTTLKFLPKRLLNTSDQIAETEGEEKILKRHSLSVFRDPKV